MQSEREGFGKGFMEFLDKVDQVVGKSVRDYSAPADDYDFLKDEHEVMIDMSDLEEPNNDEEQESALSENEEMEID
jgi:hypothetical protein